ncbi:hypothetical protein O1R50_12940 [Glycomyces luteolus]|uniref:Uncharacterized protein n=1 Tax=Glycomyces luteolus TaxID=2670330 RepID=A0A9X3SQT7_9ACTN|nr:hypothetical protein [Glycomyces luteolus]MDA1360536.1 hypothetical protein [Glycomyces luteolus]
MPRRPSPGSRWRRGLAALAALPPVRSIVEKLMDNPPEPRYTQAEAYAPMEAAAADAVTALPDFPGFKERIWTEMPATSGGIDVPGFTIVEITYVFSLPDSGTPLVRETYVDVLREHWSSLGYTIFRDAVKEKPDRTDRSLVATRPDGISLWYWVSGYTVLRVQSGPVTASDHEAIEHVPPTGGVRPGGRFDKVGKYFPDGIPADGAVDPFDSPDSYEDVL